MGFMDLKGTVRTGKGKGPAGRLRRAGEIPAIVYGGPGGPQPVAIRHKDLAALVASRGRGNVLINLSLAGGNGEVKRTVLLKEVQRDPVRGGLVHADFQEIVMDRKIRVEVPLVLEGVPVGKTKGGLVEWALRRIAVECLPLAIPDALRIDISGLDVGDALHVRDLPLAAGVRVLGDPGRTVVSVTVPAAEEEAAAAAVPEAAAAEPEVLTKREGKPEAAATAPEEKGKKEKEPEKKGKEKE